jgi:hypothetical protein
MTEATSRISRRIKLVVVVLVLVVVVVAVGISITRSGESRVVRSSSGNVFTLEAYSFVPGNVEYEVPYRPFAKALRKVLPNSWQKKFKWLQPGARVVAGYGLSRKEPVLTMVFSCRSPSGTYEGHPGTRVVVANELGQEYDRVVNSNGGLGVFEIYTFPRRGKELWLRLMDGNTLRAEFKIRNPSLGPHPVWKASPLPITVTNAGLEVTLEECVADKEVRKTRCVFRVKENGVESTEWAPAAYEVSDATGNHWRPSPQSYTIISQEEARIVMAEFLGALWAEEQAWKLRVEFKRLSGASKAVIPFEFLSKPAQVRSSPAK